MFQVIEGVYLPDDCTETPIPADPAKNFFRWTGEAWEVVPKPQTAADLVGIVIPHTTQTPHDQEMRKLIQQLGEGADGYRIARGEDLSWCIEEIPQEEIDAQEITAELSDFDMKISALKDRMATAMLQGDQETVTALQAEYKSLMGEE